MKRRIREEVEDGKFCILVDEAVDESGKEQMAMVLRFIDSARFIRERFFEVASVCDTSALTLKTTICDVLARYNLQIENLRGQGYDGASNMRGVWNGLQALFLRECPYAYFVHCFTHRLQLVLLAGAQQVHDVWLFFSSLGAIVNFVGVSVKRHTELKSVREAEIADKLASGELCSGRGANQKCILQRAGTTRWGSHIASMSSLIDMFDATCTVLGNISHNGNSFKIKCEVKGLFKAVRSFEFCFILHLMFKVMGITNTLCLELQHKSVDILNAMDLVSSTKAVLQKLRENGWETFIQDLISFCEKHGILIPDRNAPYMDVIDFHIVELCSRFSELTVELLILSTVLDPIDEFKSFKIDDICTLADKFYHEDFTTAELYALRVELQHYEVDVIRHPLFQNMSSHSELCQKLVETKKSTIYFLIDRLIRLVLTLPVSTATTECAFSAMKLVKTPIRSKMEDDFLTDCLTIFMREILLKTLILM